jgi:hypothetical protein
MEFEISNVKQGVASVARALGYVIIDTKPNGEHNLVRKLLGTTYPRFHIYLKVMGERYIFNLHLDQKKPSYEGSHAHSGEYEGPIVMDEADRVKEIIASSQQIAT